MIKNILFALILGSTATAASAQVPPFSPEGKSKDVSIGGVVNANGSPQLSPTAFSVSHPTTGRYVITFSKSFSKVAVCVFNPVSGAAFHTAGLGVRANSCDVTMVNTSNQAADVLFTFIATNAG